MWVEWKNLEDWVTSINRSTQETPSERMISQVLLSALDFYGKIEKKRNRKKKKEETEKEKKRKENKKKDLTRKNIHKQE